MNALEFIKARIDKLVTDYPNIRCRYEHDVFTNTHLIEIVPAEVYEGNENYAETETQFISDFIDLYPYENICFITDTSLVKIKLSAYTKEGVIYAADKWEQHRGIFLGYGHHGTQAYVAAGDYNQKVQVISSVMWEDEEVELKMGENTLAMAA